MKIHSKIVTILSGRNGVRGSSMLIRSTREKIPIYRRKSNGNKNRVTGRNSRGNNQVTQEDEQTMSEQLQSENEQTSIDEEIQVHEEIRQAQVQQDEKVSAQEESTSPELAINENLNEEQIIKEEQDIVPEQGNREQKHEDSSQQEAILNEENTQELQQEINDGKEERPLAIEDIV